MSTISEFHKISHGAFELFTFTFNISGLTFLEEKLDPDRFECASYSILLWIKNAITTAPGKRPLCIDCDKEFGPGGNNPVALVMCLPFAANGIAMISGICAECAIEPDIYVRITTRLRKIWPDLREIDGGRA